MHSPPETGIIDGSPVTIKECGVTSPRDVLQPNLPRPPGLVIGLPVCPKPCLHFDSQSLLRKALVVEEKKLKASQKLNRRLQLTKMTHDEREKVWMEEMSEGILGGQEEGPGTNEVSVEEGGVAVEGGGAVAKRPVRAEERKTRKQRRKEILRKKEVRSFVVMLKHGVLCHVVLVGNGEKTCKSW